MQPHDTTNEIPYGYCQCGCGQKTKPIPMNDTKAGRVRGEPAKYIGGHQNRKYQHLQGPNPGGLCMCGCGQPTKLADGTDLSIGNIKGKPGRYIPGHYRAPKKTTVDERFWMYCTPGKPDECWEWHGALNAQGYGQLSVNGRPDRAHRISYEIHTGSIPDGLFICHKCDNPPCCNPNHLFLGTCADNTRDMLDKGRNAYSGSPGESHPGAKMTEAQIVQIRALWSQGISQSEIGRRFGISQSQAWSIVRRKSWTHIP